MSIFNIFQSSRLVSQVHMMAEQNVKKKYLICQIQIKVLKQHANPNSSLHNLKIYSSKGCRKTSKDELYVAMYLTNTAVLNIPIFSRKYHFRLQVSLLRLMNTFTIDTDENNPVCYKENDAKTFANLAYYFMLTNHYVYCRLARLTGVFYFILVQCCVLLGIIRRISNYALDPFHLQRTYKLCRKYEPVRITHQKQHLLIWSSETTKNLNIYLYSYQTETAIFYKA